MDPLSLAAIAAVCAQSVYVVRSLIRAHEQERVRAAQERAEIMTRIQAPERIILPQDGPVGPRPPLHVVPDDEKELGKVGLIFAGGDEDDAS